MTDNRETSLHADEPDIVRWLDGALAEDERKALAGHVATCAACSERRDTIARRAERLSRLLGRADVPPSTTALQRHGGLRARAVPGPSAPLRWRIAAVISLSLAGAAAVPPVRAWVVSVARSAWTMATGRVSSTPAPQTAMAGAVTFTPTGSVLTIRAPARPGATLTLEVVESERVSAVGSEGQALPGLLVLPNELRIEEDPRGTTNYLVRVPLRLKTVRVMVGGRPERTFVPSSIGELEAISLAP